MVGLLSQLIVAEDLGDGDSFCYGPACDYARYISLVPMSKSLWTRSSSFCCGPTCNYARYISLVPMSKSLWTRSRLQPDLTPEALFLRTGLVQ